MSGRILCIVENVSRIFWWMILCIWEIILCIWEKLLCINFGNILCIWENLWYIRYRFFVFQKSFDIIEEAFSALLKKDLMYLRQNFVYFLKKDLEHFLEKDCVYYRKDFVYFSKHFVYFGKGTLHILATVRTTNIQYTVTLKF